MRHDDRRSFEFPFQLAHEPRLARFMKLNGILRRKSSRTIMDRGEIIHQLLCALPSEPGLPVTVKIEVGPKRTPQEPNTVEFELVVIQYVDVGRCGRLHVVGQAVVLTRERMVTRQIDFRGFRIVAHSPHDVGQPH